MLVGLLVAGYLVALGTTPAGEGLRLLGHLAHAHGAPVPAAPAYRPDPATVGLSVLPTLRTPAHGGHARHTRSGPDHEARPERRPSPSGRVVRARTDAPSGGDGHRHGDTVHSHETPALPAPAVLVRVSVDTHRLPDTARVPAPPPRADAPVAGGVAALQSVNGSVDTPPPIRRG